MVIKRNPSNYKILLIILIFSRSVKEVFTETRIITELLPGNADGNGYFYYLITIFYLRRIDLPFLHFYIKSKKYYLNKTKIHRGEVWAVVVST